MRGGAPGRWLERLFGAATGVLLAAVTLLTTADVVGRYLFNRPVSGAFELTEVLMALLIFAAVPLVSMRHEHIAVDLLDPVIPARLRGIQHRVIQVASAVILGVLAWVMVDQARQSALDRLATDTLRVPLAPVLYFGALAILVAAVAHLVLSFAGRKEHRP